MKVSGSKTVKLNSEQTYQLLTDPKVLAKAIPGVKELKTISEYQYETDMEVGVAGIKGRYKGHIHMKDVHAPVSYRLLIKGEGPMGFLESDVAISLKADGEGTVISYDGDATVGGTVAGVGSRMLSGVAKLLIGQFFNGIAKEAAALNRS